MSIYITNALYLSDVSEVFMRRNRPLIGYHSVMRRSDIQFTHIECNGGSCSYSFYNASNAWSPITYTSARAVLEQADELVLNTFALDMTNPNNEVIDYFALAAHNLGSKNISFQLQYGYDGFGPTATFSTAVTTMSLPDDRSTMLYFDGVQAPYWRLRMVTNNVGETEVKIGHVKLGRLLRLERPMYVGVKPFGLGSESKGFNMESDDGNYLGQIVTSRRRNWAILQPNNTPEFARENVYAFIDHLNGFGSGSGNGPKGTFFGAWRPDDYPDEVIYGWKDLQDDVYPVNAKNNGMMEWNAKGKAIL